MKTSISTILATTLSWALAGSALAQPPPAEPSSSTVAGGDSGARGLGLGVAAMLFGGPAGPSIAYDAGAWHLDSMFYVADEGAPKTDLGIGARFWWHLHRAAAADFSVGGGLGFRHDGGNRDGDGKYDQVNVEGGMQIRAFIATNVALNATAGLSVATADAEGFALLGQFLGGVGLHYYFF